MAKKTGWGVEGGLLNLLERVHPEGHVHAGAVGEEGGQGGLLKQSKDQDLVSEAHAGNS